MDRTSTFRTARLLIHVPHNQRSLAAWSLHAVDTRRGVPYAGVLQQGWVPLPAIRPTEVDLWEALDRIVSQYTLH